MDASNRFSRTDIADELIEDNKKNLFADGSSSFVSKYLHGIIKHTVDLEKNNVFERPQGRYVTIDSTQILTHDPEILKSTKKLLSEEIRRFLTNKKKILVIGIGNRGQTSDSLGPKVATLLEKKISLENSLDQKKSGRKMFVFAPNISFNTGIESFDIVKCLVSAVKPDALVVVDSLCSRKIGRIGTSFQISDVGLAPGSGIGGEKNEISKPSMGVFTVAIGVPMVVFASELALELFFEERVSDEFLKGRFREKMKRTFEDFVVTPRDIDSIVSVCANVIADSIEDAILPKEKSTSV